MITYRLLRRDEELGTICVGTSIRHAESIRLIVFEGREFIRELTAPNGLATRTIAKRVSGLNHELADDAMKYDIVVVPVLRVRHKVLHRLRCGFWKEAHRYVAVRGMYDC